MTPAEIIYHRRVRLLALGDELGNVAQACRQMGISRTRYCEWTAIVGQYGLEGLMPKIRRAPQLPNATPTHIVEDLLTLAVVQPTIGCRQYADRLADRSYDISKTTVQKLLVDHGLGRRAQRVARLRRSRHSHLTLAGVRYLSTLQRARQVYLGHPREFAARVNVARLRR